MPDYEDLVPRNITKEGAQPFVYLWRLSLSCDFNLTGTKAS